MLSRRKILVGLIAAPAIVKIASIMPVRGEVLKLEPVIEPIKWNEPLIPSWLQSFQQFQNTPYYERMGTGLLGGPMYAQQQIMQFRETPGHVMGQDLRRWFRKDGFMHDDHLRQQIREAIHAQRLKNEA